MALAGLAVGACAPPDDPTARIVPAVGALNTPFEVRLHGVALDPLSVTPRSVRVSDDEGQPLAARVRPLEQGLSIELIVDAALWREPPAGMVVELAGGLSGHALLRRDGRPLASAERLRAELRPRLAEGPSGGLRLVGLPPQGLPLQVERDGWLRLEFDGVLDPERMGPGTFPLVPEANGVRLAPLAARFEWFVIGGRSQVDVAPAPWSGTLWLVTRRLGLRALDGTAPEPRLEREVRASG